MSSACAGSTAAAGRPGLAGRVAHVPMDGFHLTNAELERLGRRDRKGAPDTFDARAYAAVLAAVRDPARPVVTAPSFDHAAAVLPAQALDTGEEAVDVGGHVRTRPRGPTRRCG